MSLRGFHDMSTLDGLLGAYSQERLDGMAARDDAEGFHQALTRALAVVDNAERKNSPELTDARRYAIALARYYVTSNVARRKNLIAVGVLGIYLLCGLVGWLIFFD